MPPAKPGDVTDAVVGEEEDSSQAKGVQVDLKEEEKSSAPADGKAEKAPATPPDRSAEERRWKALESQVAATRRINEDLRKQVSTLNERLQPPVDPGAKALPKGTAQETIDQYDQLVTDGKWQEAVRLLTREEYKAQRDIEKAQDEVQRVQERRLSALERSKLKVESLYPALHRETGNSEATETQLFNEAVAELSQEDDQFLHDPYAPELAMRRMEDLAQARGIALTRSQAQAPVGTPRRAGQTSMPVSRGAGGASTYSLTPEQKGWCDTYLGHLPEAERYKHYAKYAKMAETTGGVDA